MRFDLVDLVFMLPMGLGKDFRLKPLQNLKQHKK